MTPLAVQVCMYVSAMTASTSTRVHRDYPGAGMRDLLAYCTDFRQWTPGTAYAAELAAVIGGSLTGLYASRPLPTLPPAGNVVSALAEWMAEATNELHCAMLAGREFAAWARGLGAKDARWQVALGDPRDILDAAGSTADLIVLDRPEGADGGSPGTLLRAAVLSDRPCIVVPPRSCVLGRLERIALAWDGSATATRSLHAAVPLLRHASDVLLLRAAQALLPGHGSEHWPLFDPLAHLAAHGITAREEVIATRGVTAGHTLLEVCSIQRADLLVAGANGKARRSEGRLGETTDYLMQHATLPLFFRH